MSKPGDMTEPGEQLSAAFVLSYCSCRLILFCHLILHTDCSRKSTRGHGGYAYWSVFTALFQPSRLQPHIIHGVAREFDAREQVEKRLDQKGLKEDLTGRS